MRKFWGLCENSEENWSEMLMENWWHNKEKIPTTYFRCTTEIHAVSLRITLIQILKIFLLFFLAGFLFCFILQHRIADAGRIINFLGRPKIDIFRLGFGVFVWLRAEEQLSNKTLNRFFRTDRPTTPVTKTKNFWGDANVKIRRQMSTYSRALLSGRYVFQNFRRRTSAAAPAKKITNGAAQNKETTDLFVTVFYNGVATGEGYMVSGGLTTPPQKKKFNTPYIPKKVA